MKQLVEYIAQALVDHPDKVEVKEIVGERTVIYEIRVGEGDLGKIIGKEGRTAKAIRSIIAAAAMKQGKRAQVEILE
jgi:predicted RNA-binding protein YlqC (UPF0109 family)